MRGKHAQDTATRDEKNHIENHAGVKKSRARGESSSEVSGQSLANADSRKKCFFVNSYSFSRLELRFWNIVPDQGNSHV
jgi:hypothetical protein